MSSLALICGTAEKRISRGMQEPWLLLGGLRRKQKILIKGSSMKGVLFKQHSLVVSLGGVA